MAYEDVYGQAYWMNGPTDEEREAADTGVNPADPVLFSGFASHHPLLLERPSRYVRRMADSMRALVQPPDSDEHNGIMGRFVCSPIVSIPFPVLYGDETLNGDAVGYPLLHMPSNHRFDPETIGLDVYALTLSTVLSLNNVMRETGDGDIIAYPLDDPYGVDDDMWSDVLELVNDVKTDLMQLNIARIYGFTLNNLDEEREACAMLFETWGVTGTGDEILANGKDAATKLESSYDIFTDLPFRPFDE